MKNLADRRRYSAHQIAAKLRGNLRRDLVRKFCRYLRSNRLKRWVISKCCLQVCHQFLAINNLVGRNGSIDLLDHRGLREVVRNQRGKVRGTTRGNLVLRVVLESLKDLTCLRAQVCSSGILHGAIRQRLTDNRWEVNVLQLRNALAQFAQVELGGIDLHGRTISGNELRKINIRQVHPRQIKV